MAHNDTKLAYRRFIDEGFNQGRFAALDELLDRSYVDHDAPPGTPPGPDGIKQIFAMFRAAFPDLHVSVDEQIGEGDLVASRITLRGTQRGELFGVPASHRAVTMTGLTMIRFAGGRMVEGWVKNDVVGLMQQIAPTLATTP